MIKEPRRLGYWEQKVKAAKWEGEKKTRLSLIQEHAMGETGTVTADTVGSHIFNLLFDKVITTGM
jgi:hypothetical protein